jgi:hypothetical protein
VIGAWSAERESNVARLESVGSASRGRGIWPRCIISSQVPREAPVSLSCHTGNVTKSKTSLFYDIKLLID